MRSLSFAVALVSSLVVAACSDDTTGSSSGTTSGSSSGTTSGGSGTSSSGGTTSGSSGTTSSGGSSSGGSSGTTPSGFVCGGTMSCNMITVKEPAGQTVTIILTTSGGCSFIEPTVSEELAVNDDKSLSAGGKKVGNYTYSTSTQAVTFSYDLGDGAVQLSSCKKK